MLKIFFITFLLTTLFSCTKDNKKTKQEDLKMENTTQATTKTINWEKATITATGLKYLVVKEGVGEKPKQGNTVTAHYTGKLTDGTKFDSSVDRGEPFTFTVGIGQVIKGWDEAFIDMKKGESRTLFIPYNLAYGDRGFPPVIPAKSDLIFEVELIDFK